MKRLLVVLLVLGLAAGALAPAQAAKKKKKKPVPVDVTYNVVWASETCALSTTTELAADESCGDPFAGSTTGDLGNGAPTIVTAIDGLPLTFDASKPIKGTLNLGSYTLAALADAGAGQPLGAGEAQWHIAIIGDSAGDIVTIGEVDTEPYDVTPGTGDYEVTFEIAPDAGLTGKVFDKIALSFEQTGSATLHGALRTDGTSKLTLGAFAVPKK